MWAADVAALAAAGARYIQIEESVVLRPKHRADFPLVAQALERIARAAPEATVIVHLACGSIGDLLQPFLDIPGLGGLGLDFTDAYRAPNLAALESWSGNAILQAGIADARSIRVETATELNETLAAITSVVPPENCWAAPSTALLYLPRHAAFEKLATLAQAAHGYWREWGIMKNLPLLPISTIGSLPKPPDLFQAEMAPLEQQDLAWMRRQQEAAVTDWIATQESLGIDVLVDGEQYRRSMTTYFLEGWGLRRHRPGPGLGVGQHVRPAGRHQAPGNGAARAARRLVPLCGSSRRERR